MAIILNYFHIFQYPEMIKKNLFPRRNSWTVNLEWPLTVKFAAFAISVKQTLLLKQIFYFNLQRNLVPRK
jgi:hypothetical protein